MKTEEIHLETVTVTIKRKVVKAGSISSWKDENGNTRFYGRRRHGKETKFPFWSKSAAKY